MRTQYGTVLLIAFGLTVALALVWLFVRESSQVDAKADAKRIAVSQTNPLVRPGSAEPERVKRRDLVAVEFEIEVLRQQLLGLQDEQQLLQRNLDDLEQGAPIEMKGQEEEQEAEPGNPPSDEDPAGEQILVLEESLEYEAKDPAWAAWAQDEFQRSIESSQVAGATLLETDCRATMCRFDFSFEDDESRDQAIQELFFLVPWNGELFFHGDPEDDLRTVFYAAREGENLPRYE
jgi:hypothetical protein